MVTSLVQQSWRLADPRPQNEQTRMLGAQWNQLSADAGIAPSAPLARLGVDLIDAYTNAGERWRGDYMLRILDVLRESGPRNLVATLLTAWVLGRDARTSALAGWPRGDGTDPISARVIRLELRDAFPEPLVERTVALAQSVADNNAASQNHDGLRLLSAFRSVLAAPAPDYDAFAAGSRTADESLVDFQTRRLRFARENSFSRNPLFRSGAFPLDDGARANMRRETASIRAEREASRSLKEAFRRFPAGGGTRRSVAGLY